MQTGAAAEQMLAIDKQMQELLEKMQRHNQLIGAQHLDTERAHKVHLFHRQAKPANGPAGMSDSAEWPAKIDFSMFNQVLDAFTSP